MKRRVFVAINFNVNVTKAIGRVLDGAKLEIPPDLLAYMRFIPEKNWHLTVSFLGDQNEDGITGAMRALKNASAGLESGEIIFDRLSFGPPGKHPRMLWLSADGESSRWLAGVKERVEDELEENGARFARERRKSSGHVTIARFDFSYEEAARLPVLKQKFRIPADVAELDLMESELRRDGAEYSVLQKFPLIESKNLLVL